MLSFFRAPACVLSALLVSLLVGPTRLATAEESARSSLERAREALSEGKDTLAVKILKGQLAAQPQAEETLAARMLLARTLIRLGKTGRAQVELMRARRLDAEAFAALGGAELLASTAAGLVSVGSVVEAAQQPPLAAQVFVIPSLRGGPRGLWTSLADAGVDLGIVRAFHLRGDRAHEGVLHEAPEGAYFKTSLLPLISDRLGRDCSAMHAAGLRCFAWMTTRRTPLELLGKEAYRDVAWNPETGDYEVGERLDPFNPRVVQDLELVYRDLAASGADGVLFQDDLNLRRFEGFSKFARKAYRRETGRKLEPAQLFRWVGKGEDRRVRYRPEFEDFARFKRDRLLDLADRLQSAAREHSPGFEVALNLFYETALSPENALRWFSQDLEAAAARDFRYLSVMAYHRQMGKELDLDQDGVLERLEQMAARLRALPRARERVLVKLQSIDWVTGEAIPAAELARMAAPFRDFSLCLAPVDDPRRAAELFPLLRARGTGGP